MDQDVIILGIKFLICIVVIFPSVYRFERRTEVFLALTVFFL